MRLPEKLLGSLQGIEGFDQEAFERVHQSGEQVTSIRINPLKLLNVERETSMEDDTHNSRLTIHERVQWSLGDMHSSRLTTHVPWSQYGYYLDQRPSFTFDPLFHAGCYYVQEASSMFLEEVCR